MNRRDAMKAALGGAVVGAMPSAAAKAAESKSISGTQRYIIDVCKDTGTIDVNFEHVDVNKVLRSTLTFNGYSATNSIVPFVAKTADGRKIFCAFPAAQHLSFSFYPEDGVIESRILEAADAIRKYEV